MAFSKVNRIVILRVKPSASIIRFKKDLHNAVNAISTSKKQPSYSTTSRKTTKQLRRNVPPPHPLDLSIKKSLSSYVPEPMTKPRNLTGTSTVSDYKRGWLNLAILNFDKFKGVTNKIKGDLLSVDEVVRDLISFKPDEYSEDMPDNNDNNYTSMNTIKTVQHPFKQYDDKSAEIANKFDSYDNNSLRTINNKSSVSLSNKNNNEFYNYSDDGLRERNTNRSYVNYEDEYDNDRKAYKLKMKKYRKELQERDDDEDLNNRYESHQKNNRAALAKVYGDFDEEFDNPSSSNISAELLPFDETTKELISFKDHEKVTVEELSEINQLGGKAIPVESLIKNRIRPYKPQYNKKRDKKNTRSHENSKNMRKNKNYDEFEGIDEDDIVYNKSSKRNLIKKDKSPEKIAKFKKFEEFEEINEDDLPTSNRTLRKKTEDSIYYPSYEEYEKATNYYK